MKASTFLVLVAVTVSMAIAAAVSVTGVERTTTVDGAGETIFPDLAGRADALTTMRIRGGEQTLTIERRADGWALAEKNGYPVPPDAVRKVVMALAQFEKVEAKTRDPDRYARLQVENVDSENAQSKEVALLDADGRTLAEVIVGKFAFGVGEDGGLYVRKPDEDRTWLVRGRLDVGTEPRDWVDRRIVDVASADVKRVAIVHPDGETVEAVKESRDDTHLALRTLPEGARPKRPGVADGLAAVLTGLDLDDLAPADSISFAADKTVRATVVTFDGMTVNVDLTDRDGENWIRVSAAAGSSDGGAAETVRALAERTQGWAYRVPSYKVAPFSRRLADFADLAPPAS